MGVYAVQRSGCIGCGKRRHRLSLVCPQSLSVYEEMDLPFDEDEGVSFGSSLGLLYFVGHKGKILICNLTTRQMKVLPPPKFDPLSHSGQLRGSCLGYDATSEDYKVIRYYVQYYTEEDAVGVSRYGGSTAHFELYSFKRGSWEDIPMPDSCISDGMGVYVKKTGCCYWAASRLGSPDHRDDHRIQSVVLSFDFATKSFSHFPLPRPSQKKADNFLSSIVDCRGSLAAFVYWKPRRYESSSAMSIEIYIRNGTSWDMSYAVSFADVNQPLGLIDGHLLVLEAKHSSRSGQLVFYDLQSGIIKTLSIYDTPSLMSFKCYLPDCPVTLPESEPMTLIPYDESTDPLPVASEVEEEEEERKPELKNRIRSRTKAKRKKKKSYKNFS